MFLKEEGSDQKTYLAKVVRSALGVRDVQKSKRFDFNCVEWFFPLHSMPGISTENFKPLDQLEDHALAPKIIQRKSQNVQRKILIVSILKF